jgi:hypothetical protein
MLSSFASWCAETCISASEGESQKPHQGFAGQNPVLHRGIEWSKSTLALGLPEWAGKTASGSRCCRKQRIYLGLGFYEVVFRRFLLEY